MTKKAFPCGLRVGIDIIVDLKLPEGQFDVCIP